MMMDNNILRFDFSPEWDLYSVLYRLFLLCENNIHCITIRVQDLSVSVEQTITGRKKMLSASHYIVAGADYNLI